MGINSISAKASRGPKKPKVRPELPQKIGRKLIAIIAIVVIIVVVVMGIGVYLAMRGGGLPISNWPMSQHDAARTGYNSYETMLTPPLVEKWEFEGASQDAFDSISSANGMVYVGMQASIENWADRNRVYAIDAATGVKKWEFTLNAGGRGSMEVTPAIANNLVYFGGQLDDKLYALRAETGQIAWEFKGMIDMYCSHPAVVGGIVYASGGGTLYALDEYSGLKKWKFQTGSDRNTPAFADGTVYIGSENGFLYSIDAETGSEKWSIPNSSRLFSCPLVSNGVVYIDASNTVIKALDAETGSTKWEVTLEGEELPRLSGGGFALANNILYVSILGTNNGYSKVRALNSSTGLGIWSFDTGALNCYYTLAVANGIVYACGLGSKTVYALDATTGVEKWSFQCDYNITTSPVIADGVLYVGAYNKLYAFRSAAS